MKQCPFCAEEIQETAKKCKHCGEFLDGGSTSAKSIPNKNIAGLLAFFLGGFGIHKFYQGKPGQGILYLLFCWTFIPAIISFFEALILWFSTEEAYAAKFDSRVIPKKKKKKTWEDLKTWEKFCVGGSVAIITFVVLMEILSS